MKFLRKFLLTLALAAFFLDWLHMIYHLCENHALWNFPGVPAKLLLKTVCLLIPAFLFLRRKRGAVLGSVLFMMTLTGMTSPAWASSNACQNAKGLLEKSGVSREASENWLGHLKVKPPHGSFPQEMDKITWWGEFQPFEFWQNPEFQAVWIRPDGEQAAIQKFHGTKCRLAKTVLPARSRPRGLFESGMWHVVVTCDDIVIDKQTFAVLSSEPQHGASDKPHASRDETTMIWAEEALKEK